MGFARETCGELIHRPIENLTDLLCQATRREWFLQEIEFGARAAADDFVVRIAGDEQHLKPRQKRM